MHTALGMQQPCVYMCFLDSQDYLKLLEIPEVS